MGAKYRAAVDPGGQWRGCGILVARLEKPEEDVLIVRDIDIATERFDAWGGLADAIGDLLVPHGDVQIALGLNKIRRCRHKLRTSFGRDEPSRYQKRRCCHLFRRPRPFLGLAGGGRFWLLSWSIYCLTMYCMYGEAASPILFIDCVTFLPGWHISTL